MALVSGTANAPVLPPGWTPVNYTGSNHDFSVANSAAQGSNDWKWNYDPSNPLNGVPAKQWANAKDTKGNLWVWVPRYTYRAVEFADDPEVKIRFSSGTTDDTASVDGRTTKKHNAFKFGTTELTGIWVPKYAAHKDTVSGDIPGFKPSQTAWTSIAVNDIFTKCLALKNSITTSPTTGDSHMLKNIEWGAAGMLGKAIGKQRPERNSDNTYKTGHGPGSGSTTTSLDTTGTTSTTGNVTGIFDMVGNTYEYVASYVNNGHANLNTYCASLVAADAKYKDVFPKGASDDQATNYSAAAGLTDGMMIHETSTAGSGGTSWKNWNNTAAYSDFPYSSSPVFMRGGYYGNSNAGLAYLGYDNGSAYSYYGFRACFVNLNSAPLISGNDANLGDKTAPFSIVYQVSDADSDSITVTEKVNDTVIRTITNAAQNTDLELVISLDTWNGLAINTPSTITIKADDGKGGVTTRTYTFTKTNAPPTITVTSKVFPLVTWTCADAEGTTIMTRIKINGTVKKTVDNPVDEQSYTINIDDLNVGDNTITIEAQDNDWSTSSVNLTCTKTGVSHPLKEVRVRYNITPPQGTAKEIVAWLTRQKDPGFDVNAAMSIVDTAGSESYSGMTKSSVDKGDIVEEQYVGQVTTAEEKLTLKFNLTRTDTAIDKAATKLLGAIS